MKKSPSFLARVTNPTVKGSQLILYVSSSITQILRSSRGRYKIFGVVQYLAALYKDCMLDYLKSYRIKSWPVAVRNSKTVQDSMKYGRKVFRLLRWIEEIGILDKSLKKANNTLSLFKFLRHLLGIFYYISDNIVWIAEAGVINKYISDPSWKWETAKNIFSLVRYFLLLAITLLKVKKIITKESDCNSTLVRRNVLINEGNEGHGLMLSLFRIRYKRRSIMLSLMKNFLRILMLYKAAKLPGSHNFSMIFHDACGIISYTLGAAKLLALQSNTGKTHSHKRRMTQCNSMDQILRQGY